MEMIIEQISEPLIVVLVPLIVAGIRRAIAQMPKWLPPILAGALGPAVDQILTMIPNVDAIGWQAVLLGWAGVGLREVVDQLTKANKGA